MNSTNQLSIKYDKINTKYNRLWEQVTNIALFLLAALVAYSIASIQYINENPLKWTAFMNSLLVPLVLLLVPVILILAILLALLILTGKDLHHFLNKQKILD